MNKKLLVTLVILVLLYPLTAWVMGRIIESRASATLAQMTDQAPYISVIDNKYHRGWYTSEQDLTISLFGAQLAGLAPLTGANPDSLAKGVQVTLHSVIHHGPMCGLTCFALARVETHMVLSNEVRAALTLIYGPVEPLNITSRMGFFGGGTSTFTSPALKETTLPGGGKLSWDGFKITVDYTRHRDAYRIDGAVPHLLVDGPDGKRLEIKSVSFKSNSNRVLGMLYAGDAEFAIDSISYAGVQGSSPLLISDFKYVAKSTIDSGFFSFALQLDSGAVGAAGVKLKDVYLDFSFKHLDMATLATLNDKLRALYKKDKGGDAAQNSQAIMALLKEQGLPLLLKQPELSIDRVGLDTASGQVLFTGTLAIPGVTAEDLAGAAGSTALLQKLVGDFEIALDDSALNELPGTASILPQLQNMAQQGYFTHENGRWHATIHSVGEQSTFNGKVFQPGAMAPAPPPQPQLPAPAMPRH